MLNFKREVSKTINVNGKNKAEVEGMLEIPKDESMGDLALPCFMLAKELRQAPNVISENILKIFVPSKYVEKAVVTGGYLNFFLNKKEVYKQVTKNEEQSTKDNLKKSDDSALKKPKVLCLDFSSVNLAKFLHVGHMRNTVSGMVLANIFEALGYDVKRLNYLGDYGLPFGLMIAGYKRFGLSEKTMDALQNLYVKIKELEKTDEEFAGFGRKCFKDIENGDRETMKIFELFRNITMQETLPLFERLGLKFDSFNGELYYSKFIPEALAVLNEKKLLKESNGRKIVKLGKFGLTDSVILREDGASVYITRDIAAIIERKSEFKFDKLVYLTGKEQELNFKQLFKIAHLAKICDEKKLKHIMNGLYSLESGAISSRLGKSALLKDIMAEADKKAMEVLLSKSEAVNSELSQDIANAAIIFSVVSNNLDKDIVFNLERAISFDGETGPYLQYTYARICSILNKCTIHNAQYTVSNKNKDSTPTYEQFEIAKLINNFHNILKDAAENFEPSLLARWVLNLAKLFNKFYNENKVLCEDEVLRAERVKFCGVVKNALEKGLKILGIKPIEKM